MERYLILVPILFAVLLLLRVLFSRSGGLAQLLSGEHLRGPAIRKNPPPPCAQRLVDLGLGAEPGRTPMQSGATVADKGQEPSMAQRAAEHALRNLLEAWRERTDLLPAEVEKVREQLCHPNEHIVDLAIDILCSQPGEIQFLQEFLEAQEARIHRLLAEQELPQSGPVSAAAGGDASVAAVSTPVGKLEKEDVHEGEARDTGDEPVNTGDGSSGDGGKTDRKDVDRMFRLACRRIRGGRLNPQELSRLVEAANHHDSQLAAAALIALSQSAQEADAGREVVRKALSDDRPDVRRAACIGYARLPEPGIADKMRRLLRRETHPTVQAACLRVPPRFPGEKTVSCIETQIPLWTGPIKRVAAAVLRKLRRLSAKEPLPESEKQDRQAQD